jgi:hypothetical protein
MKQTISILLLFFPVMLFAQNNDSTRIGNFKEFCRYLSRTDSSKIDLDLITDKYVDVGYIREDPDKGRYQSRLKYLKIFSRALKEGIQDVPAENLQIQPLSKINDVDAQLRARFAEMQGDDVYRFDILKNGKSYANWLCFRKGELKVTSWTLIDQGGYRYFLKLNLVGNSTK